MCVCSFSYIRSARCLGRGPSECGYCPTSELSLTFTPNSDLLKGKGMDQLNRSIKMRECVSAPGDVPYAFGSDSNVTNFSPRSRRVAQRKAFRTVNQDSCLAWLQVHHRGLPFNKRHADAQHFRRRLRSCSCRCSARARICRRATRPALLRRYCIYQRSARPLVSHSISFWICHFRRRHRLLVRGSVATRHRVPGTFWRESIAHPRSQCERWARESWATGATALLLQRSMRLRSGALGVVATAAVMGCRYELRWQSRGVHRDSGALPVLHQGPGYPDRGPKGYGYAGGGEEREEVQDGGAGLRAFAVLERA